MKEWSLMNLSLPRKKTQIVGKPGVVTVSNKVGNVSSLPPVTENNTREKVFFCY